MRRRLGWRRELGIFAAAYLLYQVVRILSRGDPTDALANAHRVFDAESVLGLDIEAPLQRALRPSVWLTALDWVYLAAQTVALVAGLVAVYLLSRRVYAILRTTIVASWLV